MRIHDGIFSWQGFGGVYHLAAGRCRLRIFDLSRSQEHNVTPLKPMIVVVSDLPEESARPKKVSVRSCAGHIATTVAAQFSIDPQRMIYLEYYPATVYGDRNQFSIPAKFDAVDFVWHGDKALHPKWRPLATPLLQVVAKLIGDADSAAGD